MTTHVRPPLPPEFVNFKAVCSKQGRKLHWVAAQMGMSYGNLANWLRRYPGFPDTPDKRARLCEVLGITEADIWDSTETPAGAE